MSAAGHGRFGTGEASSQLKTSNNDQEDGLFG